ncbi:MULTISPECIES: hypothetical protein [unclassified Bradyrhizobium]|uniref:hypothetical protein n=1 Tax=unclassified Bradyrhizobium TaxID=2631580 RepID=UPI0028EF2642|nr:MULTISPECIES: hypothetical protein [unclassified Bradyrhizobium]
MTVYLPAITETDLKKVILALQQLGAGRSNATGTLTLAASAASTTISDKNCSAGSVVIPIPTTANAATELGNGTMYLSAVSNGSFTFTHANNVQTDRIFKYAITG